MSDFGEKILVNSKNAKIIKYINLQKSKSAGEFSYMVHARFVELYKDELHDLLGPNNQLKLRDYGEVRSSSYQVSRRIALRTWL